MERSPRTHAYFSKDWEFGAEKLIALTSDLKIVNCKIENYRKGVVALPMMLLIAGIVIELGISGVALAFFLSNSGLDTRLGAEALFAARSGAQDGILRVMRDKDASYTGENDYTMTVGGRTATVTITKDSPITGQTTIVSTATALTRTKRMQAVVLVDSTTGEVNLISFDEAAL